jgi:hypothetical protein
VIYLKFIRALFLCVLCLISVKAFAVSDDEIVFKELVGEYDNLKIAILNVYAWRDWQPIVSRPGDDYGSPLLLIADFTFTNLSDKTKNAHWEAFLKQEGINQIIPIELWDSESEQPWGGKIKGKEKLKVQLRTNSGPYLKSGNIVTLFIHFYVDGESISLRSKPIKIMETH